MCVYSCFWIDINNFDFLKSLLVAIFGFNHLWYLAALLPGGLLLHKLKRLSDKKLIILAVLCLLTGTTIQYLGKFEVFSNTPLLHKITNYPPLYKNFIFFGFPFLTIGYLIHKLDIIKKIDKKKLQILLFLSIALILTESLIGYYSLNGAPIGDLYYSYLLVTPVILISSFVFKINTKKQNSKKLSLYSIAIYLIHPWIIYAIYKYFKLPPTLLSIVTLLGSIGASYFLILLNRKIKYLF
jgi:membrane-bound acyltransferase YfiQ involved in biofilm formation